MRFGFFLFLVVPSQAKISLLLQLNSWAVEIKGLKYTSIRDQGYNAQGLFIGNLEFPLHRCPES